ncbi:hypothetical protein JTE90_014623 [Oedothorax gibbosus]|uniref:DUF1279 domain-containing protein n=1 Tax=Oedothorax gibbosus TaxID=931172 RepID=A0AAV6VAT2_9ARAC|nr:hypothetical protein JTE90_014623 [Oedothorax gibbosus]
MNIALTLKLFNRSLLTIISKRHYNFTIFNDSFINNYHYTNSILKTPVSRLYLKGIASQPRWFSSDNKTNDQLKKEKPKVENLAQDASPDKISQRTRLKLAVRDYGATIVVFHVAIALTSLGISYLAVSSGLDAVRLLTFIGFSESVVSSKVAVGGSTFVIAYALHKCFAPVRIGITLSVAPFIVRYLRRVGFLKPPKRKS